MSEQRAHRIGVFYLSHAPGQDRQPIVLPNGGEVYVRVTEAAYAGYDERKALGVLLDQAAPSDDEFVMNTHPLPMVAHEDEGESGSRGDQSARPATLLSQPSRSDAPVTTHTPGPWRVGSGEWPRPDGGSTLAVYDEKCTAVALAYSSGHKSKAAMSADARLIAAAPDLLAALKELLCDPDYHVAIGGNPNAVTAMLARAEAAISKAEGSQP